MKVKKIIVPRRDYRLLDWLRLNGSKGRPVEWFYEVLFNDGKSEIEAGQFINKYMTLGILQKIPEGRIRVVGGINCAVKFDYDPSEPSQKERGN